MYWFAGTGTAHENISTAKLQVLSKILSKTMLTRILALI